MNHDRAEYDDAAQMLLDEVLGSSLSFSGATFRNFGSGVKREERSWRALDDITSPIVGRTIFDNRPATATTTTKTPTVSFQKHSPKGFSGEIKRSSTELESLSRKQLKDLIVALQQTVEHHKNLNSSIVLGAKKRETALKEEAWGEISRLEESIENYAREIELLERKSKNWETQATALREQLSLSQNEVLKLNDRVREQTERLTEVSKIANDSDLRRREVEIRSEDVMGHWREEIKSCERRWEELFKEEEGKRKIMETNHAANLLKYAEEVGKLQSETSRLRDELTGKQSTIANLKIENDSLKSELSHVLTSRNSLETQVLDNSATIEVLHKLASRVVDENELIHHEAKALKSETESQNKIIEQQKRQIEQLILEVEAVGSKYKQLKTNISNEGQKYEKAHSEIGDMLVAEQKKCAGLELKMISMDSLNKELVRHNAILEESVRELQQALKTCRDTENVAIRARAVAEEEHYKKSISLEQERVKLSQMSALVDDLSKQLVDRHTAAAASSSSSA